MTSDNGDNCSPLSESLLSEQSVREALLSGSSGLPLCFLFFFLV